MTSFDTIKGNIDRKIENLIINEKLTIRSIIDRLTITKNNFEKLLLADVNSSARLHMMTMYIEYSKKRVNDLIFADTDLSNSYFFAGISDLQLFKLLKLRDKVSQDVLESELY